MGAWLWPDLASLRGRLVVIPTMILLAGLIATLVAIASGARGRVQAEARSGMTLGGQLLTDALADVRLASDPARAFAALVADLPHVRHVSFATGDTNAVPSSGLFAHALEPEALEQVFPVTAADNHVLGRITMRSNPADEMVEIRDELLGLTALLVTIWASIILLLRTAVTRGLRPLRDLGAAFDTLERGETARMRPVAVAELSQIGEQFNALAAALDQATADNRLLIERLMLLQEAERRELAAELHDEIGPLLFGIRTDASCILRWSAEPPAVEMGEGRMAGIPDRARSLAAHADGLQRINSRMLKRLRPIVLDEMGLSEALSAMIVSWRARLPGIVWSLDVREPEPALEPATALAAFRIVQEALTNAARHSGAGRVGVAVHTDGDMLTIAVRDDGSGLSDTARRGYGLLGMGERARQAGGSLTARRLAEGGTLVSARLRATRARPEGAQACASC